MHQRQESLDQAQRGSTSSSVGLENLVNEKTPSAQL